jgi:hypothetical protein
MVAFERVKPLLMFTMRLFSKHRSEAIPTFDSSTHYPASLCVCAGVHVFLPFIANRPLKIVMDDGGSGSKS